MFLLNRRNAALLLYLIGTGVAHGQQFSYGVKGGVATLEPTRYGNDESKRYIAGATVEYGFWRGLAVEADFLYRRTGNSTGFINTSTGLPVSGEPYERFLSSTSRTRAHVLELPVLGKYYFREDEAVQPFVLTGYSFRKARADSTYTLVTERSTTGVSVQRSQNEFWTPTDIGVVVGAGVRWRVGRVALMPEFRYSYWGAEPNYGLPRQQADFLLGITF